MLAKWSYIICKLSFTPCCFQRRGFSFNFRASIFLENLCESGEGTPGVVALCIIVTAFTAAVWLVKAATSDKVSGRVQKWGSVHNRRISPFRWNVALISALLSFQWSQIKRPAKQPVHRAAQINLTAQLHHSYKACVFKIIVFLSVRCPSAALAMFPWFAIICSFLRSPKRSPGT